MWKTEYKLNQTFLWSGVLLFISCMSNNPLSKGDYVFNDPLSWISPPGTYSRYYGSCYFFITYFDRVIYNNEMFQ